MRPLPAGGSGLWGAWFWSRPGAACTGMRLPRCVFWGRGKPVRVLRDVSGPCWESVEPSCDGSTGVAGIVGCAAAEGARPGAVMGERRSWRSLRLVLRKAGWRGVRPRHAVADAPPVEDVGRCCGVVIQLAPDGAHHGPHRPYVAVVVFVPHPAEQLFVGEHSPGVGREFCQQPVLGCCQVHGSAPKADLVLRVVDGEVANCVGRRRLRCRASA